MATAVPRNIPLLEVPAANPTQLAASYTSSNSNSIKITNGATTARDVNVHLGSVPAVTSAISRGLSTTTKVILILEEPLLQQHPQLVRHRLRRPVLQVRQQQPQQPRQQQPQQPRQRQLQLLLRLLQQRQQQQQRQQR
ncbi:unnamed protein product, partial [Rotaria magnacalcarata]